MVPSSLTLLEVPGITHCSCLGTQTSAAKVYGMEGEVNTAIIFTMARIYQREEGSGKPVEGKFTGYNLSLGYASDSVYV